MNPPLLAVEGLGLSLRTRHGPVAVLRDVALRLDAGETLGLVGESGSGKTMAALAIIGLLPQPGGVITAGSIRLRGEELVGAGAARLRQVRGGEIGMIFQEPMTALNPLFSVGEQVAETLRAHEGLGRRAARARAEEMLRLVGVPGRARDYPHQLSGGMRQRAMIAMALACRPSILIADEPTTALDVTVQAQILDLLRDIQRRFGAAILLITHDMGVIREMADRVAVMYAGRIVEEGGAAAVLNRPAHPYSRALIACIPQPGAAGGERQLLAEIPGLVPPPGRWPEGCAFMPRCVAATARCRTAPPDIAAGPGHSAACWLGAAGAAI
ncbi:MAG TPA: ABC transporter ATP-binding protein [Stellaceae bacterium]|nr:ABC transporter ATP-binding protein [Stellaceae bacterium]